MTNLDKIDHVVVVMLENRSFDHMLGYLSLQGHNPLIEGLSGNEENTYAGSPYGPEHLTSTIFEPDPGHSWEDVEEQLSRENGGFVANFASRTDSELGRIMGYHDLREVPIYHFLAAHYSVCDHWHASVPGPTQPNRYYAMSGTSEGRRNNAPGLPTFTAKTVFHQLTEAGVSWRYYSHDLAFLRAHKDYRVDTRVIDKVSRFYTAIRDEELPTVCWIDPDFGVAPINFTRANDDHPPHDTWEGQRLVGRVYNALLNGPQNLWERVVLIVTYDEHGGFYDHVVPGAAPDDDPGFQRYGVRVPSLIASPWIPAGAVSSRTFDHTSLIKTLLERFCRDTSGSVPSMGKRVDAAASVEELLSLDAARADRPAAPVPYVNFSIVRKEFERDLRRPPTELQRSLALIREECLALGIQDDEL